MVTTYDKDAPGDYKQAEELRCIRALLERFLRHFAPEEFVDYQMEKFGKDYKT